MEATNDFSIIPDDETMEIQSNFFLGTRACNFGEHVETPPSDAKTLRSLPVALSFRVGLFRGSSSRNQTVR